MKKITKFVLIILFTMIIALAFLNVQSFGATGTKYFSLYLKQGQSSRNGRPTGFYTSGLSDGGSSKVPIIKIIDLLSKK